jgi:hypothetical protein
MVLWGMDTHFVGFKGDEFTRARKIFGMPDFIHRQHDKRAVSMFMSGDRVIFANGTETPSQSVFSFDDSEFM